MTADYDASGNQLHWGSTAYSWDPFNNLKTFNNSKDHRTFLYTADGERIWTSDFTDTEAFDTWTFTLRGLDNKVLTIYETQGNNPNSWTLLKDYLYRDSQLLAAIDYPASRTAHFTLDHLGTPRLAKYNNDQWDLFGYFAYGEPDGPPPTTPPAPGAPAPERMKFTGHERDLNADLGVGDDLDYMHARYANLNLGRFLSVDPARSLSAQPSGRGWNRFAYARANAIGLLDPDGKRDRRSASDVAILEDPDVLAAVGEIFLRTHLDRPLKDRQEAGALVTDEGVTDEGKGDFGIDGGVISQGDLTSVKFDFSFKPGGVKHTLDGTREIAATIHSHPGSGIVQIQGSSFRLVGGMSSEPDRQQALTLNVPVYIVNGKRSLLVVRPNGAATSTTKILTRKDYDAFLLKAISARISKAFSMIRF